MKSNLFHSVCERNELRINRCRYTFNVRLYVIFIVQQKNWINYRTAPCVCVRVRRYRWQIQMAMKKAELPAQLQFPFLSPRLVLCRRIVMTQSDVGASQCMGTRRKPGELNYKCSQSIVRKRQKRKTLRRFYMQSPCLTILLIHFCR